MVKFSKKRNSQKRKVVTRRNTKKRNTRNKKKSNSKRGGGNAVGSTQDDYNDFFHFLVCNFFKNHRVGAEGKIFTKCLANEWRKQKGVFEKIKTHFPGLEEEQFLKLFNFYAENTYEVVTGKDGAEADVTKQKINIIKEVSEFGYNNGLGLYANNNNVYGFGDEKSTKYHSANTIDKNTYTYDERQQLFEYFKAIYNRDALLLKIKS